MDARVTINTNVVSDPRAEHFWDGNQVASVWFAREIERHAGIAWDVYYLYGPDAEWGSTPKPLIDSGATVIGEREALKAAVLPLLTAP